MTIGERGRMNQLRSLPRLLMSQLCGNYSSVEYKVILFKVTLIRTIRFESVKSYTSITLTFTYILIRTDGVTILFFHRFQLNSNHPQRIFIGLVHVSSSRSIKNRQ